MKKEKVWMITGAGRGMGVDITKAALAAGFKVVATGRNTDKVVKALGEDENLLVVKLDVTKAADAASAVEAAIARFGRIDTLVNNAANFYAGFFEELTPEQMEQQLQTSLIGPMNATRAASKFGLEGWIQSLPSVDDYNESRTQQMQFWKGYNGQ